MLRFASHIGKSGYAEIYRTQPAYMRTAQMSSTADRLLSQGQGGFMGSKYKTYKCVYKSCSALGYVVVYTHDFNTKKGLHMCKKHAAANGQPILW
jgi:hypothetical protein